MKYDLENYPLEVKTNRTLKKNDLITIWFRNADGAIAGRFWLYFSPLQYKLTNCHPRTDITASLPSETDKIWRITLSRTSNTGLQIQLQCNDGEIFNIQISDSECTMNSDWRQHWSKLVAKIKFEDTNTVKQYYKPQPGSGDRLSSKLQ